MSRGGGVSGGDGKSGGNSKAREKRSHGIIEAIVTKFGNFPADQLQVGNLRSDFSFPTLVFARGRDRSRTANPK
jgi:hypothetical protein